jgi:putative phosphoesterase
VAQKERAGLATRPGSGWLNHGMKVAIISDIHDQIPNLKNALGKAAGTDALICCGDLNSPFIVKVLGEGHPGPIHVVFGNNDGDRFRIALNAEAFPQITLHGEYAELELGGRTFAVNHFDNIGRGLAKGEAFDVVCFGHNHRFEISPQGGTLLINPGEIFGGLSGEAGFVIYDTDAHAAERVAL